MTDKLVERLEAALSLASVTPGFANDMYVWSELAGAVQEAIKALASSSVPEQTLQAEAIDIVRRFIRATDDKGHLNVPAIHAAQDRARALFAKLSPKAPQDRGASQEDGR